MQASPLHILQLYHDCGPGGAEQMILDLSRCLRDWGQRITAITCREGWLPDRLKEDGFDTFIVPQRRRFDLSTLSKVLGLVRDLGVDIVHAHELPAMMGMAPAALINGLPLVTTLHGREIVASRKRRRLVCNLAAHGCRRVVTVCHSLEDFLVQGVGIPASKVNTIYNGINVHRYQGSAPTAILREALGIPADYRVIGTAGSLYPVKGHTYLLKAMAQVVQRMPKTICVIAGRGELLPILQQEADNQRLQEHVRFLGYRSDVPKLLRLMEVFVLPSRSEGLPLSLLEAQAAGTPVVASNVGGVSEVIEDGKTGYLVPPAQPEILAQRILTLLENSTAARAMGDCGRIRVQNHFSLESMARSYLSLYTSCMNNQVEPQWK